MTPLSEMADLIWRAIAGARRRGGLLILKRQLPPKQAVGTPPKTWSTLNKVDRYAFPN